MHDTEARFRDMYEATLPAVFGFISLRVGGDRSLAEDLAAEVFTAAVGQFNAGRADDVTLSWLRTVARRRLIDHWRRQSLASEKLELLVGRPSSAEVTDSRRDRVIAALGSLSSSQRAALVLKYVESYSVGEVAEILGRTEKAIESLLGRARSAFRSSYTELSHG